MILALAACTGAQIPDTEVPAPAADPGGKRAADPTPDPKSCGWRESSPTCSTDAECGSESTCVAGLGKVVVREPKNGVAEMGPWEREHVKFCEPKGCPAPKEPEAESGPEPAPEPGP